jgi:hypothetical protein
MHVWLEALARDCEAALVQAKEFMRGND